MPRSSFSSSCSSLFSKSLVAVSLLSSVAAFAQPKPPAPAVTAAPAPAPAAPATVTAADVAAQIQKAYNAITTYEADFDQLYDMKAFGQKKTSKGHVTFVKPDGKMRWDYTNPKDNVVVSDGTTLWSFVAADKQARKMLLKDSQMPTALSFLTGKGDLAKEFDLKLLDAGKLHFEGGWVLEGRPKVATSLYTFVLFYVDSKTAHVRRVLIVDAQDNRNRFDFEKPVSNATIPTNRFTWSPPAGVTVTSN